MEQVDMKQITARISLPEELNRKVIATAAMEGMGKMEWIVELIRKELDKK